MGPLPANFGIASSTVALYIPRVIDSEENLREFLPVLSAATWVAVDTEADSLHAYPEKLCLIQISTAGGDTLVDPLADLDLKPLLRSLARHQLLMHGADYDLRLLQKHHAFKPKRIFDTMLAARLVGMRQFGLSHLVQHFLGVKLEKGPQKANWAIRPLSPRMELYARNDTHYLKDLADCLRGELERTGRLEWHQETCERLIADSTQERQTAPDLLWRLKGSNRLSRPAMAILRELWHWREEEAVACNRPPFFILSHDTLLDICDLAALTKSYHHLLPKHFSGRRRNAVAKAVARAQALAPDEHPKPLRFSHRRPTQPERNRFLALQARRDARAAELGIDPTLIASRATLSELAADWSKHSADLLGWQRRLLADT